MKLSNRGYFGIGVYHPKTEANIGTLWRSAYSFGADFIFTIGPRYKHQSSDTCKAPNHVPLYEYQSIQDCIDHLPKNSPLIAVELVDNAHPIDRFIFPERGCYLLGAEDHGLPIEILNKCHHKVIIPNAKFCLNVAVAGSILMYEMSKQKK